MTMPCRPEEHRRLTCIATDDIDDIGAKGIIQSIMDRVGTEMPVYLSIDIDVIDPGMAPATGTPEPGGWSTRELIRIEPDGFNNKFAMRLHGKGTVYHGEDGGHRGEG